jgi:hypothetical protein
VQIIPLHYDHCEVLCKHIRAVIMGETEELSSTSEGGTGAYKMMMSAEKSRENKN